jgi:aspartate/methionine/tyrosine aminotransferase
MNPIFKRLDTTIFATMSALAAQHGAVNLGQGFPEDDGFLDVRQAAATAIIAQSNQYPPMRGLPDARRAVAEFYARYQKLNLNPESEVLITSGATEALAACLMSLLNEGDEVIVFEPFYDAYLPLIMRAGGVPKIVPLNAPDWVFTAADLDAAFGPKTRLVLITTPNNPTTHCVAQAELDLLADYCARFDVLVLSDEVWEAVVFDGPHLSVLHHPKLRDRAVKIGSAGKIFALTGWKVGFVCANAALIDQIAKAHQFLTFSTPPHLQTAVAYGLGLEAQRFAAATDEWRERRDLLTSVLDEVGIVTLAAQGTYFINIDLRASGLSGDATDIALNLVQHHGVATIPLQAFCETGRDLPFLRLCFAKREATLRQGAKNLISAMRTLNASDRARR